MPQGQHRPISVAALAIVIAAPLSAAEIGKPDFTNGDRIPEKATHDWNLGPTGARGWMVSSKMETSEARQIYITQVEDDAPADGILDVGDVILGISGKPFSFDPRTEMGKAITATESDSGTLTLIRWRKGNTGNVALQLPVLGDFVESCGPSARIESETPYQCFTFRPGTLE